MIWNREQYEERQYPVSGRNLRGHKGAFERSGYPVSVSPTGAPGIYIIVVNLPASWPRDIDPYSLPARRRWAHYDLRRIATIALIMAIVGCLGYLAYGLYTRDARPTLAGVPVDVGSMTINEAGNKASEWTPSIRWPWQAAQDAAQQTANDVREAANSVTQAISTALWLLGALVLVACLWFARGVISSVVGAVAGVVDMFRKG